MGTLHGSWEAQEVTSFPKWTKDGSNSSIMVEILEPQSPMTQHVSSASSAKFNTVSSGIKPIDISSSLVLLVPTSGQIVNPLEPIISNVNTHPVFALSRSVVSLATPLLSARDVSKLRPATRTRPKISSSKLVDNAGQVIPEAALPVSPQDQMISWLTNGSTNSLRVDHSTLGLAKIPVTSPMILQVVSTLPLLMVLVWPAVSIEHLVTPSLIISSLEDTLLTVKSFSHGATSAVTQVLTATRLGDHRQKKIGPPTGSGTARPTHCRQVTKIKVITYADR